MMVSEWGGEGRAEEDYVYLMCFFSVVAMFISGGPVIIFPSDGSIRYDDVPPGVNFAIPCVASDLSLPDMVIITPVISSEVTLGGLNVVLLTSVFIQCTVGTDTLSITLVPLTSKLL